MVGPHVERVEVVPLRLDLRALGHLVSHADKDVGEPLGQGRDRMPCAARRAVPGQGDVDRLLGEHPRIAFGLELGLPGGERLADLGEGDTDSLAHLRSRGWRQRRRPKPNGCSVARHTCGRSSFVGDTGRSS